VLLLQDKKQANSHRSVQAMALIMMHSLPLQMLGGFMAQSEMNAERDEWDDFRGKLYSGSIFA
jgi:hypothetical protein